MPLIKRIRCTYDGRPHNCRTVAELSALGWYADGLSKTGTHARRLICPYCLTRIFGRPLSRSEFAVPPLEQSK